MDKAGMSREMNLSNEGQDRNPKELEESNITSEQQTERPLNHLESPSVTECSYDSDENVEALGVHQVKEKEEFGATGVRPCSQSKQQEKTGHVSSNLEHSEGNHSIQCPEERQPVCSLLKGDNDSQVEQMNGNVEEPEMDVQKGDEVLDLTDNESENESDLGAFYEQDQSVSSSNADADDGVGNIENLKSTEIRSVEVLVKQEINIYDSKEHKDLYFEMGYYMSLFFKDNTKCLEKSYTLASIFYGNFHPTKPIIDLWAVRISVSFIPAEAREEAYRFGTFCLRVDLERGISILLAREGFFCNNNSDIICAFCGRSLQQYHLHLGDRHLNGFLERHRHICNLADNISMAYYGINLAHHVQVMQGNHDSLCVSGSHYQQQGVCTFAQQMRRLFSNIVPSGTIYNGTQRFLPWPNLVEHQRMDGNNSIPRNVNDVQMENQESNPHQDPPRENQSTTEHLTKTTQSGDPATTGQGSATLEADCFMTGATGTSADLPSSQSERDRVRRVSRRCVKYVDLEHAVATRVLHGIKFFEQFSKVDRIVQAFVDSSIGTTVIGRGFTRGEVEDGIRRLLRNGERVTVDNIMCEIRKRM